jgi:hypothetical protein
MEGAAAKPAPKRVLSFPARPVWRMAVAAGLLVAGIFAGRFALKPANNPEMAQLRGQVESLRELVALSLLQQSSPSARLRGVSYSEQIAQPDREVEQALLYAVNHDTNVNVRLSAVDALEKFAGDPEAVRAVVDAIPAQDSPLVQVALIDLLVRMKARPATSALAGLAADRNADAAVRDRAKWALGRLGGTL